MDGGESRGTFSWPVRVYYEDTDAGGIVYYANYLRFLERARTEFLRGFGVEQDDLMRDEQRQFVVRRVNVDFRAPARFNEALAVSVEVSRLRRASVEFHQAVVRSNSGELLVSADVQIACVHTETGAPGAIPQMLLEALNRAS